MKMSASDPAPDNEEEDIEKAVPENKLTSESLAEGFWLLKIAFDFFYDMDPSITWALKTKANVGRKMVHIETFF